MHIQLYIVLHTEMPEFNKSLFKLREVPTRWAEMRQKSNAKVFIRGGKNWRFYEEITRRINHIKTAGMKLFSQYGLVHNYK